MNLESCNKDGGIKSFSIIPIESRYKKSDLKVVNGEYELKRKYGKFRREELPVSEWGPGERIELTEKKEIDKSLTIEFKSYDKKLLNK